MRRILTVFQYNITIFLFWLFSFIAFGLWRKLLAILQLNVDDGDDDDDELIIWFTGIYVLGTCTHLITSYQEWLSLTKLWRYPFKFYLGKHLKSSFTFILYF